MQQISVLSIFSGRKDTPFPGAFLYFFTGASRWIVITSPIEPPGFPILKSMRLKLNSPLKTPPASPSGVNVKGISTGLVTSLIVRLPIALYPDSLGYIFSGSAVVDSANKLGVGSKKNVPLVAVYTQHDPVGEKQHTTTFQNQSAAYSLDKGAHWTKYAGNPVLKNPASVLVCVGSFCRKSNVGVAGPP